jgi:hypothetical protein
VVRLRRTPEIPNVTKVTEAIARPARTLRRARPPPVGPNIRGSTQAARRGFSRLFPHMSAMRKQQREKRRGKNGEKPLRAAPSYPASTSKRCGTDLHDMCPACIQGGRVRSRVRGEKRDTTKGASQHATQPKDGEDQEQHSSTRVADAALARALLALRCNAVLA